MYDFVGGALAARRLAMTYKAVEHIARTRPKDSPRNTKVVVSYGEIVYRHTRTGAVAATARRAGMARPPAEGLPAHIF